MAEIHTLSGKEASREACWSMIPVDQQQRLDTENAGSEPILDTSERYRWIKCLGCTQWPISEPLEKAIVANESVTVLQILHKLPPGHLHDLTQSLFLAALFGDGALVKALLTRGADASASRYIPTGYLAVGNYTRSDPISVAILALRHQVVKILLQHIRRSTFPFDFWGDSCFSLHGAESADPFLRMLRILLDGGIEINQTDRYGRTMLHCAVQIGKIHASILSHIAEMLVQQGADPLAKDSALNIPLHLAARDNRSPETIEVLLRKQGAAQVAALNTYGDPELHCAFNSTNSSTSVVEALLKAGSNSRIKTGEGRTALDLAKSRKHTSGGEERLSLVKLTRNALLGGKV
jgi:hypothetical protein